MTIIRNDETIIPTMFILPLFYIKRRNLIRIPKHGINPIMNHSDFLIRYTIYRPQCVHRIRRDTMIDAIRKPKNRSFKQSIYLSYPSSFVTIPEFSEYLMDRQNNSLAKYFSQYRSRNSASVGARVNKGNVLVMSENIYSFDQCPKHKTDSPFADPIDMHGFFFFLGR